MSKKLNITYSAIYNYSGFPRRRYGFITNISREGLLFFLGVIVSISIEQFTDISDYAIEFSLISSKVCFLIKILQFVCSLITNYCMYKLYSFSSELHEYTLRTRLEEERDNKIFNKLSVMSDVADSDNIDEKVKKMSKKINSITTRITYMIVFIVIMILAYVANGVVVNIL